MENKINRIGAIGRFKPLHNGAAAMLEAICEKSKEVIIGIGSPNKYNARNPFTGDETEGMMISYLECKGYDNFKIVQIPDSGHIPEYSDGKKWKERVVAAFGNLDFMVTNNGYVANLLKDTYAIITPEEIIKKEDYRPIRATQVRIELAKGDEWKKLVPASVANYLEENNLVERFRKEFGEETLMLNQGRTFFLEDTIQEKAHTLEC